MAKKPRRGHRKHNRKDAKLTPPSLSKRGRRDINHDDSDSGPDYGDNGHATTPASLNGKGRAKSNTLKPDDSLAIDPTTIEEAETTAARRGRGDAGRLLLDPHRLRSDLAMLQRAVTKGFNVQRKTMLRRRLEGIAAKTEADVVVKGKEGCSVIHSESKADELAIMATKVLVAMDAADMKRVEVLKDNPPPEPPTVNVNVNVTSNSESEEQRQANERRTKLLELADRIGARELVIDGRAVQVGTSVESVDAVASESGQTQKSKPANLW